MWTEAVMKGRFVYNRAATTESLLFVERARKSVLLKIAGPHVG